MRKTIFAIGTAALLLTASVRPAAAVTIYANGGRYFEASGPSQYWHHDWGQGYCGQYGGWCSPGQAQWTYTVNSASSVNKARWKVQPSYYYSRAYAFIPRRNATANPAFYQVNFSDVSRMVSAVNQMAYYDAWAPLAYGQSLYKIGDIELRDSTFGYPQTRKISFDEIKIEN